MVKNKTFGVRSVFESKLVIWVNPELLYRRDTEFLGGHK